MEGVDIPEIQIARFKGCNPEDSVHDFMQIPVVLIACRSLGVSTWGFSEPACKDGLLGGGANLEHSNIF